MLFCHLYFFELKSNMIIYPPVPRAVLSAGDVLAEPVVAAPVFMNHVSAVVIEEGVLLLLQVLAARVGAYMDRSRTAESYA